ncbi:MAG: hypothetical protein HUJ65_00300, partial [Oscillospiraceae bacterium]|nr:hypothetical protein [Oscillospiraceae bacterium]
VQSCQVWRDGKISCYAQDEDGAYFLYNMTCDEKDAAKLAPGTKISVTGTKSEWSGEVEITDATFKIIKGSYIPGVIDVTDTLADEAALIALQNRAVSFIGMTVEPSKNPDGEDVAFLYGWDGTGSREENSDLYFNVSYNGATYNFCVESDLCGNDSAVYAAVEALNIGDIIDMDGFLFWYNGPNPHITSVAVN